MAFTQTFAQQMGGGGLSVLAMPRPPRTPLAALMQGLAAQREVSLQLFATNAIRKFRGSVGEPQAVISAHQTADGGQVRLSLSSPFDEKGAEGFCADLHATDRAQDVGQTMSALLADCQVQSVTVLADVFPDVDPATRMPLLFRAVASEVPDADVNDPLRYRLLGYVLIGLDRDYLEKHYLPQMVERYFRGSADPDYRVAIVKAGPYPATLYDSQPEAGPPQAASADEVADLLAPVRAVSGNRAAVNIRESGEVAVLQLIAQHRSGSLDAAVTRLRRRNLAVSFCVLLVLCAGMAFLAISAQRAQQLARLQVDFVAGFSHELRTPVASVCMMAENMSDGVVTSEQQIRQYGSLLQTQGRRLRTMVEEVLFVAEHPKRKPKLDVRPVDPAQVMARALADEYPLIEAAGIRVEEQIAPDLPNVLADSAALRTCIGNLLSNAVKYGKPGAWIGIQGETVDGKRSPEVQLTVRDRGEGIDPGDRRQIFEPFYRGARAREAQTPGSGLGLSLVRQMMEGMGGRVTVESEPGNGSAFTLHLIVAKSERKAS